MNTAMRWVLEYSNEVGAHLTSVRCLRNVIKVTEHEEAQSNSACIIDPKIVRCNIQLDIQE